MKTDRLYNSLVYSLGLHSFFAVVAVIYMIYVGTHYKVETFEVALVSPTEKSSSTGAVEQSATPPREEKKVHAVEKPDKVTPKEKKEASETIAAMQAKKKIEKLAQLRKSVDISAQKTSATGAGKPGGPDYISMIGSRIQDKFRVPESMDKDLLAIISIRIAKSGSVTVLGFEKKSGNPLYDRAAIKAISDASPLPPPASEMEVAIRLHP
ncbi:MAG TPA: cell envelope integrity protein TolA [Dissulfurispiraceae bacterium]|nr:cell envelope integrity protein TolA [Dissulfurispiraceae bacterium]